MSSKNKKPTIMNTLLPQDHLSPNRRLFELLKARIANNDCPALSEMMDLKRMCNNFAPPRIPLLRKGTTYQDHERKLIRKKSTFESKIDTIKQELESSTGYYRQILELVMEKEEIFLGQDNKIFPPLLDTFSDSDSECGDICHVLGTYSSDSE